ncbi:MAG: RelA/SpoT domain-containing protein [Caulobacterales bacterium]
MIADPGYRQCAAPCWDDGMIWATPLWDRRAVNAAGRALAARTFPMEADQVLQIVNNWRSSHAFPLNSVQNGLRQRARRFETNFDVAQRIKRLESIHAKLCRRQTESMRLTQMQDIGGCRVVFEHLPSVMGLVNLYKQKGGENRFVGEKNYIEFPKSDGYRSYHLVYEYRGRREQVVFNDLKIEIQIRTRLQHAWATAVESVGLLTRQALKSNVGSSDWLRFFSLMSTAIAAMEYCPCVPGTPDDSGDLIAEISSLTGSLGIIDKLSAYNVTIDHFAKGSVKGAKYILLKLDFTARHVNYWSFKKSQSQRANIMYTSLEREVKPEEDIQLVLVAVDSFAALKRSYPNYFLDTTRFLDLVNKALAGDFPTPIPCDEPA